MLVCFGMIWSETVGGSRRAGADHILKSQAGRQADASEIGWVASAEKRKMMSMLIGACNGRREMPSYVVGGR